MINKRYRLLNHIESGSFCKVYQGFDTKKKISVAIKLDKTNKSSSLLRNECLIQQKLNFEGIPKVLWHGFYKESYCSVNQRLGITLSALLKELLDINFSKVLQIGIILLELLEKMHDKGFLHRDLKPNNILLGRKTKHYPIYLIDFGLSKKFINLKTRQHALYQENCGIKGNAVFSSRRSLLGISQSRRDDLESLALLLVYAVQGSLPWQLDNPRSINSIIQSRQKNAYRQIIGGKYQILQDFYIYAQDLGFEQRPNYAYWRQVFQGQLVQTELCECDHLTFKCISNKCSNTAEEERQSTIRIRKISICSLSGSHREDQSQQGSYQRSNQIETVKKKVKKINLNYNIYNPSHQNPRLSTPSNLLSPDIDYSPKSPQTPQISSKHVSFNTQIAILHRNAERKRTVKCNLPEINPNLRDAIKKYKNDNVN